MSWKFPLGNPFTSTPRGSRYFQPNSLVAAIWPSIVFAPSSPIPVNIISLRIYYINYMARESAGLLVYRKKDSRLEFLLAHPGGPFWRNKDAGAWTIPKGEIEEGEDPLQAAKREFKEELGIEIEGEFIELTPIRQKAG